MLQGWANVGTIASTGATLALLGTAASIGVLSWAAYWSLMEMFGWKDKAEDWWNNQKEKYLPIDPKTEKPIEMKEVFLGRKEYFNPQTGATTKNPFAGWLGLGPLFGAGVNMGMAYWNAQIDPALRESEKERYEQVQKEFDASGYAGPDK